MTVLAVDADVWVHWIAAASPQHRLVRSFLASRVAAGDRLGVVPQVMQEVLHVATDPRRLDPPLTMSGTAEALGRLWSSAEVERLLPTEQVFPRTLELMRRHRLGRKRILDTALAATLEAAGVRRLATLNAADFRIFEFVDVVEPRPTSPPPR